MNNELNEVFESLHKSLVFHSRDWAANERDAWIWGIVVGWDDESMKNLTNKFGWSDETVNRLKSYHKTAKKYNKFTD